jgi:hypothetical protein
MLPALFLLLALTGCTRAQIAALSRWHDADPAAAEQWVIDHPAEVAPLQQAERLNPPNPGVSQDDGGTCGEWRSEAIDAGFTAEQWLTVRRLMYRESRCQERAHHRGGATGLMQIMPMWADDCGGSPSDLYNGEFNLRCAVHILGVQGWQAWSTH